jgi:carbamoyl-phosphate synthase large subunit
MKSTGEVMGIDVDFGRAYAKAEIAAGHHLPTKGNIFLSVKDSDKRDMVYIAKAPRGPGLQPDRHRRNGEAPRAQRHQGPRDPQDRRGPPQRDRPDHQQGDRSHHQHPVGKGAKTDEGRIRAFAVSHGIHVVTSIAGAQAAVQGIEAILRKKTEVRALQDYHPQYGQTKPLRSEALV